MKRGVCVLLAVLAFAGSAPAAGGQSDERSVPRMTLADFKRGVDRGEVLAVDVRSAGVFADGHVPGAVFLALEDVARRASELKGAKKTIVTYCA
jgi:3-mercaptopyruvate sulfurtransferase SseA